MRQLILAVALFEVTEVTPSDDKMSYHVKGKNIDNEAETCEFDFDTNWVESNGVQVGGYLYGSDRYMSPEEFTTCYVVQEMEEMEETGKLLEAKSVFPNKTYGNTDASGTKQNVKDVQFFGDGDMWKLISKAWSENEGWMKSTKALEIKNVGVVIQVTTQQGYSVAEAVTFIPNARIKVEGEGADVKRSIVNI